MKKLRLSILLKRDFRNYDAKKILSSIDIMSVNEADKLEFAGLFIYIFCMNHFLIGFIVIML